MPIYSKEQLDAARQYAVTLAPGSYEQERVKLAIALWELTNEACAPFERIVRFALGPVLIWRVAGWLAAFRATGRALVVLAVRALQAK